MQFIAVIFIDNTEYFYDFTVLFSCYSRIIIGMPPVLQDKKTQSPKVWEKPSGIVSGSFPICGEI